MPLSHGRSRGIIGKNIAELKKTGHPMEQALAIALKKAGKYGTTPTKKGVRSQ